MTGSNGKILCSRLLLRDVQIWRVVSRSVQPPAKASSRSRGSPAPASDVSLASVSLVLSRAIEREPVEAVFRGAAVREFEKTRLITRAYRIEDRSSARGTLDPWSASIGREARDA